MYTLYYMSLILVVSIINLTGLNISKNKVPGNLQIAITVFTGQGDSCKTPPNDRL